MTVRRHLEVDDSSGSEVLMLEEALIPSAAIDLHTAYISVFRSVVRCIDLEVTTVFKVYDSLLEQRSAHCVFVRTRTYRIESQCGEHIPRRRLAVIFITAVTVSLSRVEAVDDLTYPILRFPRLSGVVVEVNHMLYMQDQTLL